jgi:hypothetical protein
MDYGCKSKRYKYFENTNEKSSFQFKSQMLTNTPVDIFLWLIIIIISFQYFFFIKAYIIFKIVSFFPFFNEILKTKVNTKKNPKQRFSETAFSNF